MTIGIYPRSVIDNLLVVVKAPRILELTPREQQIIELCSKNRIQKEVAAELNISYGTVKTTLMTARRKLSARNTTRLAVITAVGEKLYGLDKTGRGVL